MPTDVNPQPDFKCGMNTNLNPHDGVSLQPYDRLVKALFEEVYREGHTSRTWLMFGLALIELVYKLKLCSAHWGNALHYYISTLQDICMPYTNFDGRAVVALALPPDFLVRSDDIVDALSSMKARSTQETPEWKDAVSPDLFDWAMVGLLLQDKPFSGDPSEEVAFVLLLLASGKTGIVATAYPTLVQTDLAAFASGGPGDGVWGTALGVGEAEIAATLVANGPRVG